MNNIVQTNNSDFDWGMHYFRAFAIFCIVTLHALSILGYGNIVKSILQSATIYFLFISGYLCQYLAIKKGPVSPSIYYKKKFFNVFCPYLTWTCIYLICVSLFPADRQGIIDSPLLFQTGTGWDGLFLRLIMIIDIFIEGLAACQFWYIPFILPLFALSPFFLRLPSKMLLLATSVAFFLFLLFPDRVIVFPHGTSFLEKVTLYSHFTVFYLLGFVYARYKKNWDMIFKQYVWLFLFLGLVLTVPYFWNSFYGLTLMNKWQALALQKLFFIPVAICCVYKFANRRLLILDEIANLSFALYFIHMLCLPPFVKLSQTINATWPISHVLNIFVDIIIWILYLNFTFICAKGLKRVLGTTSRYLIGS